MTAIRVDLIGAPETIERLHGVGTRAGNARPVFEEIAHLLEEGETRLFRRLGGKYVRTGATRDSLTQTHAGNEFAIRDAHSDGQGLTFGTAIWYAHFQKDASGKSAVLKLQPTERKKSAQLFMDWLVGGPAL